MLNLIKEDKWTNRTSRDEKETRQEEVDRKKRKNKKNNNDERRRSLESMLNQPVVFTKKCKFRKYEQNGRYFFFRRECHGGHFFPIGRHRPGQSGRPGH
jgi:hypothetical protein